MQPPTQLNTHLAPSDRNTIIRLIAALFVCACLLLALIGAAYLVRDHKRIFSPEKQKPSSQSKGEAGRK